MKILRLVTEIDDDNPELDDLMISGNRLVFTEDLSIVVMNRLRVRFRFFKGEWFADTRLGVPYLGAKGILGSKLSNAELAAIFRPIISGTAGVDRVTFIEVTQADRVATILFKAALIDGEILNSDDFPPLIVEIS